METDSKNKINNSLLRVQIVCMLCLASILLPTVVQASSIERSLESALIKYYCDHNKQNITIDTSTIKNDMFHVDNLIKYQIIIDIKPSQAYNKQVNYLLKDICDIVSVEKDTKQNLCYKITAVKVVF